MTYIKLYKRRVALYIVIVLICITGSGHAAYWPDPDSSNSSLHLAGLEFSINGNDAEPGDEVAVFDSGGQLVGHYTLESPGMYGDIVIWIDSPLTLTVDEGCSEGDELSICVYDAGDGVEYCGDDVELLLPAACSSGYCPPDSLPLTCLKDSFNLVNINIFNLVSDIGVIDSVTPADDLQLPFGELYIGDYSDQTVTVKNEGDISLDIYEIAVSDPLAGPFSILDDECSWKSLLPAETCTVTVRFSPKEKGDVNESFDIISGDPDEGALVISLSGKGLSPLSNNPPTIPQLISPPDGLVQTGTDVEFNWSETKDPDGDAVTYDLIICKNKELTDGCVLHENIRSAVKEDIFFAGSGIGALFFGIILGDGVRNKRRKIMIFLAVIIMTLYTSSCGSGGGGGGGDEEDPPPEKVTVTGTVLNKKGEAIKGAEVTISSDPVTVTTDGKGDFSAVVAAGEHEIVIRKDSEVIYSGEFTCGSGKTFTLGNINTEVISQQVIGLTVGTTYYWRIIADDGRGGVTESEVRSFTVST